MDKLEKALEKARKQRGQERAPHPVFAETLPPLPPLDSETLARLDSNRILAFRLRNANADLFRILRTRLVQAMSENGHTTLAVTSPAYGEGKTTIALNLAISIAQDVKQTALLVDLDIRKPCVHTYLGLAPAFGLTDYLAGQAELKDCLIRPPFERMTVLPTRLKRDNSSETLGSPKMSALARELKNRYPDRFILYDMPPLLAQDDPIAFLPHVDVTLMVVQEGVTREDDVARSMDILRKANANVIGTVLNDCA